MKAVFVGPSCPDASTLGLDPAISLLPPAAQGDLAQVFLEGANVIGLIDGTFEANAAVWHKEILFALAGGAKVFGASSMGALRAAECHRFGMIGVGAVYRGYASGETVDDDAVAIVHAPGEVGFIPLSEPLVNISATLDAWLSAGDIMADEHLRLTCLARALFFKERTFQGLLGAAGLTDERRCALLLLSRTIKVDQKRLDAVELMRRIEIEDDRRMKPPSDWTFVDTLSFQRLLGVVRARPRRLPNALQSAHH
ncbi:hypothetical protein HDIA_2541 [Hartmannibacter diazotrophicus]|uniref:TfuA-like core domain-containing protein n=1 Tax=Hartmannibacter diazotrophicus TaxID=1482074 RepID=A0A2C9D6Z1_9HYPH|nr:TfuA-like protein [Hartmannibacter diazotrophicus]SON56082.1 hypothetical protein HDIA_2541 [Hartmannibacter diazotrophicus]